MGIWKDLGMGGYRGFSRPAVRLLQQAVQLAGNLGCEQADTGHLLLAMLQQQGAAAQFLTRKKITEPEVRRQLAERRSGPAQRLDRQAMAPDLRRTMDYALIGAQNATSAGPSRSICSAPCWRMTAAPQGCCWPRWGFRSPKRCGSAAS